MYKSLWMLFKNKKAMSGTHIFAAIEMAAAARIGRPWYTAYGIAPLSSEIGKMEKKIVMRIGAFIEATIARDSPDCLGKAGMC